MESSKFKRMDFSASEMSERIHRLYTQIGNTQHQITQHKYELESFKVCCTDHNIQINSIPVVEMQAQSECASKMLIKKSTKSMSKVTIL